MRLSKLLEGVKYKDFIGDDREVEFVCFDSRAVRKGGLFCAVLGIVCDGHDFIESAIGRGARVVVCERLPESLNSSVSYITVSDSNEALSTIAANFYDNPSRKLALVGITGTNGKTTTATLLYELFEKLGYKTGLISTVINRIHNKKIVSTHTTPDAICLNAMLAEMVAEGCDYCFAEVSSHSLVQKRTWSLHFTGAIFSNITHDHLDYHESFAEYIKVKKTLFDSLSKGAWALTNLDDKNGAVMLQNTPASRKGYSLRGIGDYNCKIIDITLEGMLLEIDGKQVWVRLLGKFNAYNVLALYSASLLLGADSDEVLTALSTLGSVCGRFECLHNSNGITAIVDYAHTPDALQNVIETIRTIGSCNKLIVVCGCGGDRDKSKRPKMAEIAVNGANLAIFTSDNPRCENPEDILKDMVGGIGGNSNYLTISDRRSAIRTALTMAERNDVVLIAGKGHEDYQIINTEKQHFSDQEEVLNIFKCTSM